VLGGIDIAMLTGEITGGEKVKKNISFTGLKVNRPCCYVGGHAGSVASGLISYSFDERIKYSADNLCFSEARHIKGCDRVRQVLPFFSYGLKK
jgi:hypothetical protein